MEKKGKNPKLVVLILPNELEEEILQYLPVKSLTRFKSVSKQWRSMIESSYFINKHRICPFSNPKLVVVETKRRTSPQDHKNSKTFLLQTFAKDDHQGENDTQISRFTCSYTFLDPVTKGSPSHFTKVVGSCDGLVCIQDSRYLTPRYAATNVYIINPATRKHRKIYSGRWQYCQDQISPLLGYLGFGKDMVTRTYKMILINHSPLLKTSVLPLDREQRDIGFFPVSKHEISTKQAPIFANGSVFWLTQPLDSKTPTKLVALDLHTEKFRRVSSPSWYVEHCRAMRIWSLKDRLCLSNVLQYPDVDVWFLKTMEDLSEQWEKIFTINVSSFVRIDTKFWMLGLQAGYVRSKEELIVDKISLVRRRATLFRETLVSPYP